MMKIQLILVFMILFGACSESGYDAWVEPIGVEDVTSVKLSPNSPVLMTDGKAELAFDVHASVKVENKRTIEIIENGHSVVRDSVFTTSTILKPDRLPKEAVVIRTLDGEELPDGIFRTTKGAGGQMGFTCTINGVTSSPCYVRLIERPEVDFTPVKVPVVFHLLVQEEKQNLFDGITQEYLQGLIDHVNDVFAARIVHAPSDVDTRITFLMADQNPQGETLKEAGVNRVDVKSMSSNEIAGYINQQLIWDPTRYVNIYIHPSIYQNIAPSPMYVLDNGTSLPGLDKKMTKVQDVAEAVFTDYTKTGIVLRAATVFNLAGGEETRLDYYLGLFFGLAPTEVDYYSYDWPYVNGDTDYCLDTYTSYSTAFLNRTTYTESDEEVSYSYDGFNIMDKYSKSTTLTYEQALRVRTVIENCPGRIFH